MNYLSVVSVEKYFGNKDNPAKPDKHGKLPIFLSPIAGTYPSNAMVISGTIAEREHITIGSNLIINCVERAISPEYGRQFSVRNLSKETDEFGTVVAKSVSAIDLIPVVQSLGSTNIIDCSLPSSNEKEEPKSKK